MSGIFVTLLLVGLGYLFIRNFTTVSPDTAQGVFYTVGPANDLNTQPGMRYNAYIPMPGSHGLLLKVY